MTLSNISDAEVVEVGEDTAAPIADLSPIPVTLSDAQFAIFKKIADTKAYLESEVKKILEREEDFIVTLAEAHGITLKQGIQIKDKTLYFPK